MIESKRQLGQFYTIESPFQHPVFVDWMRRVELLQGERILEPFAGSGNIKELVNNSGILNDFDMYDIEPNNDSVKYRDTIRDFPIGYRCAITNPPYLAKNSARRRKIDNGIDFGIYDDLYKVAIEKCLQNIDFLCAIIPESFITTNLFTERLFAVISLNIKMFNDTDHPVCLALWIKDKVNDTSFYDISGKCLGSRSEILNSFNTILGTEKRRDIKFNDPNGILGVITVDSTSGDSIYFTHGEEIPSNDIKNTSRAFSRISCPAITNENIDIIIHYSNLYLKNIRDKTNDVLFTSFKGIRKDGKFRRRLDFKTVNLIISKAINSYVIH